MMKGKRRLRYYLLKILRSKEAPIKIALGFAIGSAINFFPTFGFGVVLAGVLASLTRTNIPSSIAGDLLFKSFFPVLFILNIITGDLILGNSKQDLIIRFQSFSFREAEALIYAGKAFFIGALVNSAFLIASVGIAIFLVVQKHRLRIIRRIKRWSAADRFRQRGLW